MELPPSSTGQLVNGEAKDRGQGAEEEEESEEEMTLEVFRACADPGQ